MELIPRTPLRYIYALIFGAFSFCSSAQAMLINGDFETGDLTGWTTFTTENGTLGNGGGVTLFDTTGNGDSLAATFRAGQTDFVFGVAEGGGIFQSVFLDGGNYALSAEIATANPPNSTNQSAGIFDLIFDGVVIDSIDFGFTGLDTTERSVLTGFVAATAGLHEVRMRIQRPFEQAEGMTPLQYVDNLILEEVGRVSAPATFLLTLAGLFGLALKRCHSVSSRVFKP